MDHPLVLALRIGQKVSPFLVFLDRILEKPVESNTNQMRNAEFEMRNEGQGVSILSVGSQRFAFFHPAFHIPHSAF
jgi:hypothetical protein